MTGDATAEQVTRAYEDWLGEQIPVIAADLEAKHRLMATDVFAFFRATYYLWLDRISAQLPEVLDTARLPIVGDLHAENFGTWRDDEGDLRWGINDLDELARGPWLLDPLRLATSASLSPHIQLKTKEIADIVLSAYADATPAPSPKVAQRPHLGALIPDFKDADAYFGKLSAGPVTADVPDPVRRAAEATVPGAWDPTWRVRAAGAGSLGRRRFVAVGVGTHGLVAREAKELGPGTAVWAHERDDRQPVAASDLYPAVRRALDASAASVREGDWQLRGLAPDEVRIDLSALGKGDETRLLQSMAAAMTAVHAVDSSRFAAAQREAKALDPDVFAGYVKTMKQTYLQDFENCP